MRHVLTVLLPILLIGCSVMGGEPERKARIQALIKQLADKSPKSRKAAFAELRDTARRRDIADLWKELDRNDDPEIDLLDLIELLEHRWRLPDKGWTTSSSECVRRWEKEFQDLGCPAKVTMSFDPDGLIDLDVRISPEVRLQPSATSEMGNGGSSPVAT